MEIHSLISMTTLKSMWTVGEVRVPTSFALPLIVISTTLQVHTLEILGETLSMVLEESIKWVIGV
jgi:hypothetical protein